MMIGRLIVAVCLLGLGSAFLFKQSKWDGLKVTFGVNILSSDVFASLPRKESDAKSGGWTKIGDCNASGKFRGVRYVKNNDYAVILLFDINGYIAGIQCGVLKSSLSSSYPPPKQRGHIFQEDGDRWTLTAYFTDPATICSTGRTAAEFSQDGTGTGLYIQNGSNPVTQSVRIPPTESGMANTPWRLGHCFPAMGVHYWYDVTTNMSCDDFQPVFLLYNEQQLTAFGWAMGTGQTSKRFEHPESSVFGAFLNPVPQCLSNYAKLSTMHIYMTAHPTRDLC